MVNYEGLANQFLQLDAQLLQVPALHLQGRLRQGEPALLNYLFHHHQAHPVELSRSLAVSSARIAALLGRLEAKGLIRRTPDPLNNRQVIVTLSPKGLEAIRDFRAQVVRATAQLLAGLGDEDARALLRIQRRLLQVQGTTSSDSPPEPTHHNAR